MPIIRTLFLCFFSVVMAACSEPKSLDINFNLQAENNPVGCGEAVTVGSEQWQLHDFRFYIHQLEVVDTEGEIHPLKLEVDEIWQGEDVVLLDFENGARACRNGTAEVHTQVKAAVAADKLAALRFVIGVPEVLNHQSLTSARAPLNYGFMHWSWQGGYKFTRISLASEQRELRLHLGSTECSGTVATKVQCARPNRLLVEVPLNSGSAREMDINIVLDNVIAAMGEENMAMCMGGDSAVCARIHGQFQSSFVEASK